MHKHTHVLYIHLKHWYNNCLYRTSCKIKELVIIFNLQYIYMIIYTDNQIYSASGLHMVTLNCAEQNK